MEFKAFKFNRIKKSKEDPANISVNNLYFALVGRIKAEIISEDFYINHGEYPTNYTVVEKMEEPDTYIDVFNKVKYSFRDENSTSTILKMYSFPKANGYTTLEEIKDILNSYDEKLGDNKVKPGDNKPYARTRKLTN